jgi:hypothetical protein
VPVSRDRLPGLENVATVLKFASQLENAAFRGCDRAQASTLFFKNERVKEESDFSG